MKRLLLFALLFFPLTALAQNLAVNGDCSLGGQDVVIQNLKQKGTTPIGGGPISPNSGVMASYPGCIVTVYLSGTITPATIFSSASGTPLANPFTANVTDGHWLFYVATGTYDVVNSGAGMPTPRTYTAVQPGGGGGGGGGAFLPLAGGTMTGEEITAVPTSTTAMFNLPHGTAPSVPLNGDVWTTTLGMFVRINGVTVGPLGTGNGTVTSIGMTVPTGMSVTPSTITTSGTFNVNFSGLTTNVLVKAISGGIGNSLATDSGTSLTYTGTAGFFAAILTATGVCPGASAATGCFDVGIGATPPGNPPAGFDRMYGDSASGNVLCKTSSGGNCFATVAGIITGGPGTNNTVVKFTGAQTVGNSSLTDDGSTPTRMPNGSNVASAGANSEYPNDTITGTVVNKLACDNGSGKAIVCSHLTSTTNVPLGVVVSGAGTSGNALLCSEFWCSVISDNQTVAKDWLISSSTVDGDVHDTGSTSETNGQPNIFNFSANAGIGTATVVRLYTPDSQSASTCGSCATKAGVQQQSYSYAADTGGSANTYVISQSPKPTLGAGSQAQFKAAHTNTGASTLNTNSLGAVTIKKWSSGSQVDLAAGDITTNQVISVIHDGTFWNLLSGGGGGGGTTTITTVLGAPDCTNDETGNSGYLPVTMTTGFMSAWQMVAGQASSIYCSFYIPHALAGTPNGKIVLDIRSSDSTAGHTANFNTQDCEFTSSATWDCTFSSATANQTYTTTATAWANSRLTFSMASTLAADGLMRLRINTATTGTQPTGNMVLTIYVQVDQTL